MNYFIPQKWEMNRFYLVIDKNKKKKKKKKKKKTVKKIYVKKLKKK
jgi:hypothetical protein